MTKELIKITKRRRIISDYFGGIFYNADAERECRKKTTGLTFEGLNAALFRKFATECMELAQRTRSPDQRALFLEMASMWQQLEQRWEEKWGEKIRLLHGLPREARCTSVFSMPRFDF
jgi:hypothetical protein